MVQKEVRTAEAESRQAKAIGMKQQGAWMRWEDAMPKKLSWGVILKMDHHKISFMLKSVYDVLPSPTNLREGRSREKRKLRGCANGVDPDQPPRRQRCVCSGSTLLETLYAAEPSFRVPDKNITYTQGDTAVLDCIINDLKDHQVVWTDPNGFLLTLNQKRIIEDVRISVERPTVRDWNLHIQNVNHTDEGRYQCQINTNPEKQRAVILKVQVPPRILDTQSSPDSQTVREGDIVILKCNATGVPWPEIRWYRLTSIHSNNREQIGSSGEVLKIHNVSRDCGGTYICEAENGIGTKQTRNMRVDVQYPPEVFLPSAKMGQYPGKETFLQCEVTAHPLGELYWARDGVDVRKMGRTLQGKYAVDMYSTDDDHKKILSLRIKDIRPEDYGQYACIAKNFLGDDKETMVLYDYTIRKTTTTTTEKALIVVPGKKITTAPPPSRNRGTYDVIKGGTGRNRYGKNPNKSHGGGSTGAVRGGNSSTFSRPSVFAVAFLVALYWTFRDIQLSS